MVRKARRCNILVLTRNAGLSVVIRAWDADGQPVEILVQVVEIGRDRVKLGFGAPPSIQILRSELIGPDTSGQGQRGGRS